MNIRDIKKKANEKIAEIAENKGVEKYMELLELQKSTEKQLTSVKEAIKRFEKDPEEFIDTTEDLW